jgi:hypothetical protein
MRRTNVSLISLTLPCLVIIYSSAFGQSSSDEQVLKSRTDLVNVDVLVKQKKIGRIISNLTKDDFTIFEDGVQQMVS